MRKTLFISLFLFSYILDIKAQDNYTLNGFNGMYIGANKKELKKFKLTESDQEIEGCWETDGSAYIITNKEFNNFMGMPITRVYLTFDEKDQIKAIYVLMKTNDIASTQLLSRLEKRFGEADCTLSVSYNPSPFYCDWENESGEVMLVSNMKKPGGGPGQYFHLQF